MKKIYIILSLLIIGFLFYWFEMRPSEIRKACEASVFSKYGIIDADSNNAYRQCLVRNGLQPESIFVNTQ